MSQGQCRPLMWAILAVVAFPCWVWAAPSVLPGLKGFGVYTLAGRGGAVVKVVNLNDSGPGSLRDALKTKGPRTVVFEVGGRIDLQSDLTVSNPFCTIAGQTAPSPGILLTGATFEIATHDVLVQHLSVRVGDQGRGKEKGRTSDAIRILGPGAYNIVLDHLSASWSIDEVLGIGGGVHDVTVSNCILAEPLHRSFHPKGPHGFGVLAGDGTERLALVHNLIAHASERLPRIQGGSFLLSNCLLYNKGGGDFSAIGSPNLPSLFTSVGNLFLDGPTGKRGNAMVVGSYAKAGTQVYQKDNIYPGGRIFAWKTSFNPSAPQPAAGTWPDHFVYNPAVLDPVEGVEAHILKNAGSRPGERDSVDKRILSGLLRRGGQIIDSQSEVGGLPRYPTSRREFLFKAPAETDSDKDGYTDLEEILYQLAFKVESSR